MRTAAINIVHIFKAGIINFSDDISNFSGYLLHNNLHKKCAKWRDEGGRGQGVKGMISTSDTLTHTPPADLKYLQNFT